MMVISLPPSLSPSLPLLVSFFSVMGTYLLFAVQSGKVFRLETAGSDVTSSVELRGHAKGVYKIMSLGARVLPRHWLPSIIGRSNVIEYYKLVISVGGGDFVPYSAHSNADCLNVPCSIIVMLIM